MATPLVALLVQARTLDITFGVRADGSLRIDTPKSAASFARALRARDADVLALFDWRRAGTGDPAPCLICRRPAILRDPVEHRPAHKTCVDRIIRTVTAPPMEGAARGG